MLPALCQSLQQLRAPDQFVQRGYDGSKGGPVSPFLLPAVQHEIMDGFGAVHWSRQSTRKKNEQKKNMFRDKSSLLCK